MNSFLKWYKFSIGLLVFCHCILSGDLSAQIEVTGNINSEEEPLIGVNISEKGTTNGTVTDFDGNYNITVKGPDAVLIYSYTGYQTVEKVVGTQSTIDLTMVFDAARLDEVVVVGFGTKKKAHVTGAASSVEMVDVLANRPITNTMEALQGSIPGLQITNNSGQPGPSGLGINIRGMTSINGGAPLILLNNVPVTVEDINPQDVESVTVLKDAAATSIYGARAAFGVVLITTKRGVANQPVKFNYSSTFSMNTAEDIPEKASTYDFVNALDTWGVDAFWTGQDIDSWVGFLDEYRNNPASFPEGYATKDGLRYPLVDTDVIGEWFDESGATHIHNFDFSGGSDNSTYRVSLGYSDQDGIIVTRNDSYRKYNLNASLTTNLSSRLTATTNILYRNSILRDPLGSYGSAISFNTYTPASGNHVFDDGTEIPYFTPANIEKLKVAPKTLNDNIRLFGKLKYNLLKGLNLNGEYTFQKSNYDRETSDNQVLTVNPERFTLNAVDPVNTFYRRENSRTLYSALNIYLDYAMDLGSHNFTLLTGFNQESSDQNGFWIRKTNLINVDLPSISGASGTVTGDDSFGQWSVRGVFGRLNYNYNEKYFLEASGRYDGSSRFPEGSRFGFFPSFSAGWHLGREAIFESIQFLSDLKLRASWGEIGNQNTPSLYPAVPGMPVQNADWLNESSGVPYVTLGIPNLVSSAFTWERVRTLNFGFDAVFLEGRLSSSFDVFKRETNGMLIPGAELPAILGADAPTQNAADLESKGWELALDWSDKKGSFSYTIGATLADNRAIITKFDNPAGLLSQYYEGQEIGEIWGYVTEGYYTESDFASGTLDENLLGGTLNEGIPFWEGRKQNPGDIKYQDLNGDGIINDGNNTLSDPGDRQIIGNNTRRYQYGLFGNVSYKDFDLAFLANGVGKRDIYQNNSVRFPYTNEFQVVYISQLDYWTAENRDAYFPRNYALGGVNYGISRSTQTKYLLNGAYLRLKNLTLGYRLPTKILDRLRINNLRIYIAGENLLDINDYPDGINTELRNRGNGATYPYLRTYSTGVNINF